MDGSGDSYLLFQQNPVSPLVRAIKRASICDCAMAPSTLELESTPDHSVCTSPESNPQVWEALIKSQPRSLKVCKPHSRVYPHGFPILRPRLVSKNGIPADNIEKTSKMYVYDKERSYFEQCFREMRVLGRGLFGEALEVECLESGNHYAVKRALRTFESAGARQQKLREATNHEAIAPHANIVGFEKAWEERGRLYIQTELCGANLADYRSEFGILTEAELWKVLHDVVQALHHMHTTGMLHMDVKPSNIFISNDSTCKLGDFGLAFDINKTSRDTAEEGDKYYMAPEILNDSPTSAADVYSLGVSMLELATDVNLREHSHRIRGGELDAQLFGGGVSSDLRHMITSLLSPDPLMRPTTSQLSTDEYILKNAGKPVVFRRLENGVKSPSGPLDKDWDFEFEDEIHPPSIRYSKLRKPLRNFFRDDISDAADSVKTCLSFENSSDDESPSCRPDKLGSHVPARASIRRREKLAFPVKKLDFSDSSDVSPGPAPKRIREAV
ncbi:kinase domain protein [Ancylostoma duodenale]|uniref:non-specific serine/threonine protein kinase n=1 Tax=Ancylostoma duodenale TaxID=51022 RepID=A0A0C2H8H6_9BILA|nr:kinase domain protein [Ancylostoma duodenale]